MAVITSTVTSLLLLVLAAGRQVPPLRESFLVLASTLLSEFDYDHEELRCWLLDDANTTNYFTCQNVELVFVDAPRQVTVDQPFTVEYGLRFEEGVETFLEWMTDNSWLPGNVSSAEEFCSSECGDPEEADKDNCCIYHVNIHSCHAQSVSELGEVCGPWVFPLGDSVIHTTHMSTSINEEWFTEVELKMVGTTYVIAHLRIGELQIAAGWQIEVLPPVREGMPIWLIAVIVCCGMVVVCVLILSSALYYQYHTFWNESRREDEKMKEAARLLPFGSTAPVDRKSPGRGLLDG